MSEHLSHPRRRQVLDRPSVIERLIRVNLYFIQAQLGAAAMAAIGAVGFHRPAQPAGSSDRWDGEINRNKTAVKWNEAGPAKQQHTNNKSPCSVLR